MIAKLYEALQLHLLENVEGLKGVYLFNSHFEREEEERALDYPCVLVDFGESDFRDLSLGVQQMDIRMNLHVAWVSYKYEDLEGMKILDRVAKAVHGWAMPAGGCLMRRTLEQDTDATNRRVWVMGFVGETVDANTMVEPKPTDAPEGGWGFAVNTGRCS